MTKPPPMSPRRILRLLASAGVYASGLGTIALWWAGRANAFPLAAFAALAALALLLPRDDPA